MSFRQLLLLVLTLAMVVSGGCASRRAPIMPNTGNIPLTVWVVLANSESIGGLSNLGSRLDQVEIQTHINSLQSNSSLYGLNVNFQWNPTDLRIARDPSLLPFMARDRSVPQFQQNVVAAYWEPDTINIYFTGNVQRNPGPPPPPQPDLGLTIDPLAALGHTVDRPWILVNDGGYHTSSGFVDPPWLYVSWYVIEHEMAHYLARFRNRTINGTFYDANEHAPPTANNLLIPQAPLPLRIPGRQLQPGTERKEIWDRIWSGNWNNP